MSIQGGDEKNAKPASGSSPCSGASVEENAERLPPNLRETECCHYCRHEDGRGSEYLCGLYKREVTAGSLCDSYE